MSKKSPRFASFLIISGFLLLSISASQSIAKVYEYEIKGMKCGACVDSIKEKICGQKGVTQCDVEVGKMTLSLDEKGAPSEQKISTLVSEAGHFRVLRVSEKKVSNPSSSTENKGH
jgi:copper chaperone CopZ